MFTFKYRIKNEDINYGGHVGNERALLFFQFARMEFFKSIELDEINIGDNIGVIQKNAFVEYNKQLFLDDEISITITDVEISKLTFNVTYEIYSKDTKVINGSTLLVCFDYSSQKIKKVPKSFIETIEKLKSEK